MAIRPIVVDFETDAIDSRPRYPPKPVGFSIKFPEDRKSRYYAWGHPINNNCSRNDARKVLLGAWKSGQPILFHHAKFDCDVAETHLDMPPLPWHRVHDTMYLLFLYDPHAKSLSLKPAAEKILGMPPEEQEAVRQWLIDNKIVKKNDSKWGAHIAKAPGDLVGVYADGDTMRTLKLFNKIYPEIIRRGMGPAYDRERELMPILLENERQGIRVDLPKLREDAAIYSNAIVVADNWLRRKLKVKDLNIDADKDLAEALDNAGVVAEWTLTETGQKSVAKKNLTVEMFRDKKVASVLGYRNRLSTCVGTFMLPWLNTAENSGGIIYTNWNQVRQSSDGNNSFSGARTGRMSSNPNFQNIPKSFDDKDDGYVHPKFTTLPELPFMRQYILPDKGGVFCHRDYNQQELRILAHFEDDLLCAGYNENARLDVHDYVQQEIENIYGIHLERRAVKVLNFGMIYGMGLGKLAVGIHSTVEEAKRIKNAQLEAIPGLKALSKDIQARGKAGDAIKTWGGREYFSEEPKIINGRRQTFDYKLLNYLIQGSAADCTKQSIINYHHAKKHGRFLLTVHDETNLSVPKAAVKEEMKILRECMQAVKFDVPMLSDGKTGKNWASLTKFKE